MPIVKLALNTGLRRGEIFDLKWKDLDFRTRTLTVTAAASKGGKRRIVPLNSEILLVLKEWQKQNAEFEYVFSGKDGERLVDVKKAFVSLLREAKITDFTFHCLRHAFASELVMNGVDLNTVRDLLGHNDLRMTLRYAHLSDQVRKDAVSVLKF